MSWKFLSSLRNLFGQGRGHSRQTSPQRGTFRPSLEVLEGRLVPTAYLSIDVYKNVMLADQVAGADVMVQSVTNGLKFTVSHDTFFTTGTNTQTITFAGPLGSVYLQTAGALILNGGGGNLFLTATGDVTLIGTGDQANPIGVNIWGTTINAADITIGTPLSPIQGYLGNSNYCTGVSITSSTLVASSTGVVSIAGTGGGASSTLDAAQLRNRSTSVNVSGGDRHRLGPRRPGQRRGEQRHLHLRQHHCRRRRSCPNRIWQRRSLHQWESVVHPGTRRNRRLRQRFRHVDQ